MNYSMGNEILSDDEFKILDSKISKDLHKKIIDNMNIFMNDVEKIDNIGDTRIAEDDIYIKCIGDINKIDKLWQKHYLYISPIEKTKKMVNSKKELLNLEVKQPPIINISVNRKNICCFITVNDTNICFDDGRHRFLNIRNSSDERYIPIIIPKNQESEFIKRNLLIENNEKIYFKWS